MVEYCLLFDKSDKNWYLCDGESNNKLGTVVYGNGEDKKGFPENSSEIMSSYFNNCSIKANNDYKGEQVVTIKKCLIVNGGSKATILELGQKISLFVEKPNEKLDVKKPNEKLEVKKRLEVKNRYETICENYKNVIDSISKEKYLDIGGVTDCKEYFKSGNDTVMLSSNVDSMDEATFAKEISKKIKQFYFNVLRAVIYFFDGVSNSETLSKKFQLLEGKDELTLEETKKMLSVIENLNIEEKITKLQKKKEDVCNGAIGCMNILNSVNETLGGENCPDELTEENLLENIETVPSKLVDYYNALYKASTEKEPKEKFEISNYDSTKGNNEVLDWLRKTLMDFEKYLSKSDLGKLKEIYQEANKQMNEFLKDEYDKYITKISKKSMFKGIQKPSWEGDPAEVTYNLTLLKAVGIYCNSAYRILKERKILSNELNEKFEEFIKQYKTFSKIKEEEYPNPDNSNVVASFMKILIDILEVLVKIEEPKTEETVNKKQSTAVAVKQKVVNNGVQVLPGTDGSFNDKNVATNSQPLPKLEQKSNINWADWEKFEKCLDKSQLKDVEHFIKRFKSLVSSIYENCPSGNLKNKFSRFKDKNIDIGINELEKFIFDTQTIIKDVYWKKDEKDKKIYELINKILRDQTALNKAMENFSKASSEKNENNKKSYWEDIKKIVNDQLNTLERLLVRATQIGNYSEVKAEEEKLNKRGFIKRTAGKVAKFVEDSWNSITKKPVKLTLDSTMVTNFRNMTLGISNLCTTQVVAKDLKTLFKLTFSNRKNTYESWYDYVYGIVCDMDKCIKNYKDAEKVAEIKEAVQISLMYVFVRSMLHCDLKDVNSIREGIKQFVLSIDKDISSTKDVSDVTGSAQTSEEVMKAGTKTRQLCKDVKSNMKEVLERKKSLRKDVLKKEQCKKILDYLPKDYKDKLKKKIVK